MNVVFAVNIFENESDSDDLEDYVNIIFRRPKIFHNRPNYINYWDDTDFVNRFRLSKNTVQLFLPRIENMIRYPTERNHALSPLQQFLLCLRFYAAGGFMISSGDHAGVHKSTVSNIVRRVTNAICSLKNDYVNFPTDLEEITRIQQGFFDIARFPRVILLVDGTYVKIQSPGGNQAEFYRNRKGFFSLNVMVACDHNLKIRNIVARWPGSANDMIVYMNSNLKWRLGNVENCVIIGDSGYAVDQNFMTPLNNPITVAERRYQESLIRTRNAVERCIGIWKRRFPCLALGLRTKLELTQDIIVACSILHNLARSQNEPDQLQINKEIQILINEEIPENNNIVQEQSDAYRSALIEEYFARL